MNNLAGLLGAPPLLEAQDKPQRVPIIVIEALPGGYMITRHPGDGVNPHVTQRRSVVPNMDVLLNTVASWARDAEARELAGDNAGKG